MSKQRKTQHLLLSVIFKEKSGPSQESNFPSLETSDIGNTGQRHQTGAVFTNDGVLSLLLCPLKELQHQPPLPVCFTDQHRLHLPSLTSGSCRLFCVLVSSDHNDLA